MVARVLGLWVLLLGLAGAAPALAAEVRIDARFEPPSAAPGATVTLRLDVVVPADHYVYAPDDANGNGFAVEWDELVGLEPTGAPRFAPSSSSHDALLDVDVRKWLGAAWLEQDFRVREGANAAAATAAYSYQLCDARLCRLKRGKVQATLEIDAAAAVADTAVETEEEAEEDEEAAEEIEAEDQSRQVRGRLRLEPAAVAPGGIVTAVVELTLREGYHAYAPTNPKGASQPTQVAFDPGSLEPVGALLFTTPHEVYSDVWELTEHEHSGRVEYRHGFRVPADHAAGAAPITVRVTGQVCDANTCEDFELALRAPLQVDPAAPAPAAVLPIPPADPSAVPPPGNDAAPLAPKPAAPVRGLGSGQGEDGMLGFLLAAVGAALLSLGTPCVFPMIPITVSVFSKDAGGSRGRAFGLALVYAAGIVVTFTLFGLLTAKLAGEQGANQIAANGWVNLALGVLFVVFALSLIGAFELRLPQFLISGAARAQQSRTGVLSVLLMGFVFTLTSFTCTVPIVGGLLVEAVQGDTLKPVLGMMAFSGTFAFPFFFLALFPSAMRALPSAGGWMNAVKMTLGLLELAFAFKFFSNADLVWELGFLTWPAMVTAWVAIAAVACLYLLGFIRTGYDEPNASIGPGRLLTGLAFGWGALYLASGFAGTRFPSLLDGWLPPRGYGIAQDGRAAGAEAELSFLSNYEEARRLAAERGEPLFVDFTGVTCANCRAMENSVFPRPEIAKQLARYTRVQLYVDGADPNAEWNAAFQVRMTATAAQPQYLMLDPATEAILGRFDGFANTAALVEDFRKTLEEAADAYRARGATGAGAAGR